VASSFDTSLPRVEAWELLGLLLTAGGSVYGLIYATPSLVALAQLFRGSISFSIAPEASVGLAGLTFTVLGSFAALFLGQIRPAGSNIGASLVVWTNFIVVLFGDILFSLGYLEATSILLVGLASAVLTVFGLLAIVRRPSAGRLST